MDRGDDPDDVRTINTSKIVKCEDLKAENLLICADNGLLKRELGNFEKNQYLNASNLLGAYISMALIRLVQKANITQKNGDSYTKSLPKGFWASPELTMAGHGLELVGWPGGLPLASPRNGWAIAKSAALARMLLEDSISMKPIRAASRSQSLRKAAAAASPSVPSTSALSREPRRGGTNTTSTSTGKKKRLTEKIAGNKDAAVRSDKAQQAEPSAGRKRKSGGEPAEAAVESALRPRPRKKPRVAEDSWDPF
ncbi:hypothetical protein JAAARDRAFT_207269 [Jaapia argillacea MUCL 33604]|uniref:Uncharacterized protein n=1 Tax=Jaapia argillacea MUCL 33604 TaxID=933084 RepID=A0A067PVC2_9AGAM|nr:hypothetical protein JAAARDRAFT_207269 [Jaapia argillacea MUCL 33604]